VKIRQIVSTHRSSHRIFEDNFRSATALDDITSTLKTRYIDCNRSGNDRATKSRSLDRVGQIK
jgi:hypothetical protein